MRLPGLTVLVVAVATALPRAAIATPEWHAGVQPAVAADFQQGARWAFDVSGDADLLFGRERAGTLGYGPALELGSWAFRDLRVVPMARVLVPLGTLDLGCSAGPRLRLLGETDTGIAGRAFLGYRAFNHTAAYGTGFGLFAGLDQPVERGSATTWTLGAHFDAMWASLPFVALASWIRGSPDD